ncbi:inositol phosphorylceramide synthase [Pedobacter sp. HDW13]|uniref:phosphatase PAP2 family protein n=1 Tax=unclassified Pedobacter TaxID=2628915 RepID=UPI000F5A55A6|nr:MULTISPECIES: phosphatase PAP2 family protein [unclassified Pedobacter]QIL38008.1 inositol phosphorylceramide synthase [Pedobacter sp. HDW13]RQO68976.1 PA-phosphatase [Pedobacter sp. KBW01]
MEEQQATKGFYHRSFVYTSIAISVGYLLLSLLLVGFKTDQLVLVFIFNVLFFFSKATRKFILGFSIFIVYWILFDYMKAFPNYRYNAVHIEDLYDAEKRIFGINLHGLMVTPNEFWKINSNAFLDVLTGLFYLMWVPVPLAFAVYLFFKKKFEFVHFSLVFVWVNLLGFVVYYLFPAAPPWYVQEHGFVLIPGTPGNTAGLARFDQFFNITLFKGIYSKGSNVFAAMPSLHSAYPVIVVYYALKNKLGAINVFFVTVMLGIWFSAIYSSHHYSLDVLAGISCAILGIVSFQFLVKKTPLKHLVAAMVKKIT